MGGEAGGGGGGGGRESGSEGGTEGGRRGGGREGGRGEEERGRVMTRKARREPKAAGAKQSCAHSHACAPHACVRAPAQAPPPPLFPISPAPSPARAPSPPPPAKCCSRKISIPCKMFSQNVLCPAPSPPSSAGHEQHGLGGPARRRPGIAAVIRDSDDTAPAPLRVHMTRMTPSSPSLSLPPPSGHPPAVFADAHVLSELVGGNLLE